MLFLSLLLLLISPSSHSIEFILMPTQKVIYLILDQIKREVDICHPESAGYREAIGDPLSLSCLFGILASIFTSPLTVACISLLGIEQKSFSFLGSHMFSIFKSKVNAVCHGNHPKFGSHMDFLL